MRKVVLVTGGYGGLGLPTCLQLASKNYIVYAGTRNSKPRKKATIKYIQIDVNNSNSVKKAIDTIIAKEGRIDVLINNAGYCLSGALETISIEQAKKQFETNFFGMVRCIKAVLPYMRKQRSGKIINISSSSGLRGRECASMYCASKFAVEGLSESLYWELKPFGIYVKVIEPSGTLTNFRKNMEFGNIHLKCYEEMHKNLKDYFDNPKSYEWLLRPEEVAKKIVEAVIDDSNVFRYQVGSSIELAKEKLREPRFIMKRYPFIIKAFKFVVKKIKIFFK
ncbi:MAG: SDR family oxidoreductase [Candidatus Aenigmatarchaeota archaeon]